MRKSLLRASVAITAFIAASAALPFAGVASAKESSGRVWVDALDKWRSDIAQLSIRIRDYPLQRRYCRPPHKYDKTFDETGLAQLEEELAVLLGEFGRIQTETLASLQGSSGGTLMTDRLMLREYPKYKGFEATDDRYWVAMRRDNVGDAQRLLGEKKRKLAEAPEDDCRDQSPKKETGVIGGNPPVQPPPPLPPPPPPPVDPLAGLSRPTSEAVNLPRLADHYCSQQEKNAALALIPPELAKAQAQIESIEAYIAALRTRRAELEQRKVESHWLTSMDYEIHEAEILINDRRTTIESVKTARSLIESTPVVDCSTGKEIGALPGRSLGASVSVAGAVGEIKIPKKPYLALENGGILRLGVVDVKRTETVAAMLLGLAYDLDCLPKINLGKAFGLGDPLTQRIKVTGELETYDLSLRASGGSIVTTTEGVGIPGTGDPGHPSPAGYFLGNPAINDVMDISQSHASSLERLHFAIAQEQYYRRWAGTVAIGGTVGRLETSDSLAGSIPGYGRDFAYHTDLETAMWGLFLATDAELSLDRAWDHWADARRYAGEFSGFTVSACARAGVDFLSTDGTDRLDFTGFAPQGIRVSKDDTTFNYRLNLGLNYTPPSAPTLKLSIGAVYGQDDIHPVATRSGETGDRTRIEFKEQEVFVGSIRSTFRF